MLFFILEQLPMLNLICIKGFIGKEFSCISNQSLRHFSLPKGRTNDQFCISACRYLILIIFCFKPIDIFNILIFKFLTGRNRKIRNSSYYRTFCVINLHRLRLLYKKRMFYRIFYGVSTDCPRTIIIQCNIPFYIRC